MSSTTIAVEAILFLLAFDLAPDFEPAAFSTVDIRTVAAGADAGGGVGGRGTEYALSSKVAVLKIAENVRASGSEGAGGGEGEGVETDIVRRGEGEERETRDGTGILDVSEGLPVLSSLEGLSTTISKATSTSSGGTVSTGVEAGRASS